MEELQFPREHQQKIADWLQNVKFRRRTIGGLDEKDVWEKIRQLNDMYQEALLAEHARCEALLQEQRKGVDGT